MGSKRLILKNRHWRYTIISALLVAPVFLTIIAAVASWLTNYSMAEELLSFLLHQQAAVLAGVWLASPLLGVYLAHISYERGTIDRWRPVNKITKIIGIGCLVVIVGFVVIG